MNAHATFGTAINCIDGRTQAAVTTWVKNAGEVEYVDMITEAGCDGVLRKNENVAMIEAVKAKVMISVRAHRSRIIVVVGHHDCAGNPVSKEQHWSDIRAGVERVKSWDLPVKRVVGLWINDQWQAEEVC